ncbi:guanyl-specific ribonuclease [Lysobacter fragariae]
MRRLPWILVALFVLGLWLWAQPRTPSTAVPGPVPTASLPTASSTTTAPVALPPASDDRVAQRPDFLPPEAHAMLRRIAAGGPFEHRQDGSVFGNRERRLPAQPRGYYHEYTVETPGSRDRGARRIITGGEPPLEYWYTDDHYRSFRRFELQGNAP